MSSFAFVVVWSFTFQTRVSDCIISAECVCLYFGFLSGTRVNGPKLIGCGLLLCACSSIMSGLPYFIYGPSSHLLNERDLQLDPAHSAMLSLNGVSGPSVLGAAASTTPSPPASAVPASHEYCGAGADNCKTNPHPFELGAFLFLVVASFVNGIGSCNSIETKKSNNSLLVTFFVFLTASLCFRSRIHRKAIPASGQLVCPTWTTT